MLLDVLDAHDLEAVAASLRVPDGVIHRHLAAVFQRGDVAELRRETELIFEFVILVHLVRCDVRDFAGAVREVDEPFVAELELTLEPSVIAVRDEVRLSERRVRLDAELRGLHHRAHEALRRALRKLRRRGKRRQHHACEALAREHRRKGFLNLRHHALHERLHRLACASLCLHLVLPCGDNAAFRGCHGENLLSKLSRSGKSGRAFPPACTARKCPAARRAGASCRWSCCPCASSM